MIAFWSCPLVLANTACACMVGNSVSTMDTTFIAPVAYPVAMALTATAVLFGHSVIAFLVQTALCACLPSPTQPTVALRTGIVW